MFISASIVIYNTPNYQLIRLLNALNNSNIINLIYIVDNSPFPLSIDISIYRNIKYIKSNNVGYGSAHNLAFSKILDLSDFHLVINPDIYFEPSSLALLIDRAHSDEKIGLLMPRICYPNGETQYLCKLLPTPFNLIFRRFSIPFLSRFSSKLNNLYELRFTGYNKEMNVPSLSGCFMLLRVDALKKVGFFDPRFFMYLEDVDFSRRIHLSYTTLFYPHVTVFHEFSKSSYKSLSMLLVHAVSAIKYFNKWGWFIDHTRSLVNGNLLNSLNHK